MLNTNKPDGKPAETRYLGIVSLIRTATSLLAFSMMMLSGGILWAQNYPSKSVRIIASGAGGGGDVTSRLISQGLTANLGQPVIVENRPTNLTGEIVAKAAPDGYTLLVAGPTLWIGPLMRDDTPYDALRDFSPITLASGQPAFLVVHPSLPVKSVKDLIGLAKVRSGELNYASGGTGATPHLAAELFKSMAGVNLVRVPYKAGAPAVSALMAGEVQVMFSSASGVVPHLNSGRLRALAVGSAKPSALLPNLPTVSAAGLPGYEASTVLALFAPAKTPPAIVIRLYQETARLLTTPEAKQVLLQSGVEPIGGSPAELTAAMKSEIARLGKVIKDGGIRDQ